MNRTRALAVAAAFVLGCCTLAWWSGRQKSGIGPLHNPTDFVAFYCAARVAARGADPYRAEPLRSCERTAFAESHVPMVPYLVVPAPLPGYDLALLAPLARVPFRPACAIWAGGIFASFGLTAWMLARLTRVRPAYVCAALVGSDLYASLVPGQLVPFVVAALAACGWCLTRGRPRLAAGCAVAMLVEPNIGLPVLLALALWVPRARWTLALGVAALAGLSLAFLGVGTNAEYFARVLPVQAATEGLEFSRQYGLSALLRALGLAPGLALALGSVSYVVAVALGVGVARRAATALGAVAALAFVPAAAALVGGTYGHIAQMAAAIPLALLLWARGGRSLPYAVAATCCLAVPWQAVVTSPWIASLFPARGYVDPGPLLARVGAGTRLAQDAWAAWIATTIDRDHRTMLEIALFKLPTWGALAGLCLIVGRTIVSPRTQVSGITADNPEC